MKNGFKTTIFLAAALLMAACQKDDGALHLVVEGMNGGKVAVSGGNSYWATGDRVRISSAVLTVDVDAVSGEGTVSSDGGFEAPYYGVYPSDIYAGNSNEIYTLDLPSEYTYAKAGSRQNVQSPMVAYAEGGSNLFFRHVTAAINVQVVNYYGFTVAVDSIVVVSDRYQLCGRREVTLGGDLTVAAVDTTLASVRQVKMNFSSDVPLQVLAGDSAVVQVPVLPVGDGNHFTVKVSVHKVDQPNDVKSDFSRTQNSGGALGRAYMGYARFVTGGLFSVSATKKVVISQGNLQYQASTGTWRFAPTQYGSIGNNAGNNNFTSTRPSQEAWIDLFGWGTSGWNNGNTYYMPYNYEKPGASTYGWGYGPKKKIGNVYYVTYSLTGEFAESDWGVHNAISNGGGAKGIWRTLSGDAGGEWDYLLFSRSASTVNNVSNARFSKAKVNNIQGLIIFPDNYSHPTDVNAPVESGINSTSSEGWNGNNYDLTSWYKMEAAGAVFLPVTGRTNAAAVESATIGYYWSTSYSSVNSGAKAFYVYFASSILYTTYDLNRFFGLAVRLVREVN